MKNLNLILHAGAAVATPESVDAVRTPSPEGIWHPISHRTLYEQTVKSLATLKMRVVNEQHALARDGMRYFSLLQVANCQEASQDYAYVLGLRNSHDKSFPAGLVVGSGVFVCDNLAFSGEIRIARKHTTHIERDLPILVSNAVGQLSEKWTTMNQRFDAYKVKELVEPQVHDILIRSLDAGVATSQQIPHILNEWRNPRHDEFKEGKTAWRLFNAYTEVMKSSGVFVLPKRTQTLHGLLDAECGILSREEAVMAGTVDAEVNVANN